MARLVHFCFHTPSDPEQVLEALVGKPEGWLGGQRVDDAVVLVTLRPAGLLPDPSTPVAVEVTVGPVTTDASGLVRRLSYRVEGLVPLVRCDLAVGPAPGNGVRVRLQGEYRPTLASAGTLNGREPHDEHAAAEAIAQPLVLSIIEHAVGGRLPV
ncbi:hypothetical protein [Euzebya rosea]|uniref:hypothetical protein n=1 Tax=Euzebya rosea TaxID=2052804 RepID=UPI000D3EDC74|nr:hypothetical protein [Euzebya rosea]